MRNAGALFVKEICFVAKTSAGCSQLIWYVTVRLIISAGYLHVRPPRATMNQRTIGHREETTSVRLAAQKDSIQADEMIGGRTLRLQGRASCSVHREFIRTQPQGTDHEFRIADYTGVAPDPSTRHPGFFVRFAKS
jgi:hypothetical protein